MKTQKTKKSFKKKALLSSLSMLMVATVAVGSATFAWFTQSPTASANGLKMKATASNGLKILTQTHKAADSGAEFASSDFLNYVANAGAGSAGTNPNSFLLNPASYDITNDGAPVGPFKTTADKDNESTAKGTAPVSNAIAGYAAGSDVYKEEIYCKLVGASSDTATTRLSLTGLDVTMNNANDSALKNSIRVMLTYTEKNGTEKIIGAYAPTQVTEGATIKNTADSYSELGSTGKGKYTFNSFTSATKVATYNNSSKVWEGGIGELDTSGEAKVTVYVYLDGEDTNCFSKNIKASDLLTNVTVNLSIPTN